MPADSQTVSPEAGTPTEFGIGGREPEPLAAAGTPTAPPPAVPRAAASPEPGGRPVHGPLAEPAPAPAARPLPEPAPAAEAAPAPVSRPAILLTAEALGRFAPRAKPDFVTVLAGEGNDVLARFGINENSNRLCHFLAQVAHECAGFSIVEENLNYSAARMVQVFGPGRHSARIGETEARALAGNKEALAERVYGLGNPTLSRRLGNTRPGDGYRYRGRGFVQITGRANYRDMGEKIGVDLEANPDLAAQPLYALMTAAAFWVSRDLNRYADQNNIELITQRINGGSNGLQDRRSRFAAAKRIWAAAATSVARS